MLNEKIILGIDPGLVKTGWGVVSLRASNFEYVNCGVIRTSPNLTMESRLCYIFDKVTELLEEYKPAAVAMEEVFINSNQKSSEKLIMARTASFISIAKNGFIILQYKPNEIKKNITGNGHASKEQVYNMVCKILKVSLDCNDKAHTLDSIDALAIALSVRR